MKNGFIIFDSSAKKFILEVFGKTIDNENFIIDSNTRERVLSINGEELTLDDFAGIGKGSLLFIKKDLPSIVELTDRLTKNM